MCNVIYINDFNIKANKDITINLIKYLIFSGQVLMSNTAKRLNFDRKDMERILRYHWPYTLKD